MMSLSLIKFRQKGIFQPTFINYKFCKRQIEMSNQINIKISSLNKFQKSDFYLWSKYLINNNINVILIN